jgi:hypothetical protein
VPRTARLDWLPWKCAVGPFAPRALVLEYRHAF